MATLTIIIAAKNEARNISDCVQSASFANEVIVLDSGSTDGTQQLAQAAGLKLFRRIGQVTAHNNLAASDLPSRTGCCPWMRMSASRPL